MVGRVQIGGGSDARGRTFDFTEQVSQQISQFGEGLLDDALEARRQQDLTTSVENKGQFLREVDEAVARLDPAQDDFPDAVAQIYQDKTEQILAGTTIVDENVRNVLERELTQLSTEGGLRAIQLQRENAQTRALSAFEDARNQMLADIEADPDGAGVFEEAFTADFAKLGEVFSPSEREAIFDQTMDQATEARILGLAQAGRKEDADALLEKSAGMFTPEARRALERKVGTADARFRQDRARASARTIADLEIGVVTGSAGIAEIEAADKDGLFRDNEGKRVQLIRTLAARDKSEREKAAGLADIFSKLQLGLSVKPSELDDAIAAAAGPNASPDQLLGIGIQLSSQAGFVAPIVKRGVQAGNITTDPTILARSAQVNQVLGNIAPGQDTGAGVQVGIATQFMDFGLDPGTAAQRALAITQGSNPASRKARFDEFANLGFDPVAGLEDGFLAQLGEAFGLTEAIDIGEVSPGAVGQYTRLVRNFYSATGDMDLAQNMATKQFTQFYGLTGVGGADGGARVVQRPPERFAVPPNMVNVVPDDVRRDAVNEFVQSAIDASGVIIGDQVGSEPAWKLELTPGTTVYEIRVRNSEGLTVPLLDKTTRRPIILEGLSEAEFKETKAWEDWEAGLRGEGEAVRRFQRESLDRGEAINNFIQQLPQPSPSGGGTFPRRMEQPADVQGLALPIGGQ